MPTVLLRDAPLRDEHGTPGPWPLVEMALQGGNGPGILRGILVERRGG